jgi:hypothetical protein
MIRVLRTRISGKADDMVGSSKDTPPKSPPKKKRKPNEVMDDIIRARMHLENTVASTSTSTSSTSTSSLSIQPKTNIAAQVVDRSIAESIPDDVFDRVVSLAYKNKAGIKALAPLVFALSP